MNNLKKNMKKGAGTRHWPFTYTYWQS